jgi:hypothetical protein
MSATLNWQPEPTLVEQILKLAEQRGQPPETLLTEAILLYLENQPASLNSEVIPETIAPHLDPLVGLFSGSPELATQAEDILERETNPQSSWT